MTIEERFWEKVDKKGEDECWNWKAYIDKDGYGRFGIDSGIDYAHRVSYILAHGEIFEELCVLHHCDQPDCCNPKHLFLGTNVDNMKDRDNKGRCAVGERSGQAKLTQEMVNDIRRKYCSGEKIPDLANEYNVASETIRMIVRNEKWKDGNYNSICLHGNAGENNYRTKLTWEKVNQIRERYKKGEKQSNLAKEFDIGYRNINNIINNKRWKI